MKAPESGRLAEAVHIVEHADTAEAVGSGDVPVLATPRLIAWLEAATVAAIQDRNDATKTSVGTRVELEHLAASPVGAEVTARAELSVVDGRTLRFDVSARQGDGTVVAEGRITRVLVDRERFLAKTRA